MSTSGPSKWVITAIVEPVISTPDLQVLITVKRALAGNPGFGKTLVWCGPRRLGSKSGPLKPYVKEEAYLRGQGT